MWNIGLFTTAISPQKGKLWTRPIPFWMRWPTWLWNCRKRRASNSCGTLATSLPTQSKLLSIVYLYNNIDNWIIICNLDMPAELLPIRMPTFSPLPQLKLRKDWRFPRSWELLDSTFGEVVKDISNSNSIKFKLFMILWSNLTFFKALYSTRISVERWPIWPISITWL